MPTYDYECSKCGHRFEIFQKMSDKPVIACPKCKGTAERLIGAGSGIIFKGKGFYHTDYKNKKKSDDKKDPSCPMSSECKNCPKKDGKDA